MKKSWALLYALCLLPLRVVTDPYAGLNYNQINVYEFENEYLENCITVHEPDHSDGGNSEDPEEDDSDTEDVVQQPTFIPWRLW